MIKSSTVHTVTFDIQTLGVLRLSSIVSWEYVFFTSGCGELVEHRLVDRFTYYGGCGGGVFRLKSSGITPASEEMGQSDNILHSLLIQAACNEFRTNLDERNMLAWFATVFDSLPSVTMSSMYVSCGGCMKRSEAANKAERAGQERCGDERSGAMRQRVASTNAIHKSLLLNKPVIIFVTSRLIALGVASLLWDALISIYLRLPAK